MIAHATNNTISGGFVSQLFAGADMLQQAWILAAVWAGAAAALLLLAGPKLGRQPAAQRETIGPAVAAGQRENRKLKAES